MQIQPISINQSLSSQLNHPVGPQIIDINQVCAGYFGQGGSILAQSLIGLALITALTTFLTLFAVMAYNRRAEPDGMARFKTFATLAIISVAAFLMNFVVAAKLYVANGWG